MFRHSSTGKSGIGRSRPSSSGYSPRRSFSPHSSHRGPAGRPQVPPRPAGHGFHKSYAPHGGGPRKSFSSSRGRRGGERIDVSRFINKAVITETTEHFKPEHHFADFAID